MAENDTSVENIATGMRKKGMSTRDIIVALYQAGKTATHQMTDLADVIVTDVKAAKIKSDLDTIATTFEKQANATMEAIKIDLESIEISKNTAQFFPELDNELKTKESQLEQLTKKRTTYLSECNTLITELKTEIKAFSSSTETANKATFLAKIKPIDDKLVKLLSNVKKLSSDEKDIAYATQALKGKTEKFALMAGAKKTSGQEPAPMPE
jgi:ABC-type transporter Mla subunit MlaD